MLERVFARLGEREEDVFASRANDIQKMMAGQLKSRENSVSAKMIT